MLDCEDDWDDEPGYGPSPDEDDEPDWDDDRGDDYEPDPTDHPEFERYEHERYMAGLSPAERLAERVRSFIWRHTWKWRLRRDAAKWKNGRGHGDEPPF